MRITKKILLLLLTTISFSCFAQTKPIAFSEINIYKSIDENAFKLLKESGAYSVSIGIVKDGKTYTKHYGEIDKGKGNKANDNTLFEIASITKIFTGTLIANAALDGKINLNDDIRKYLTGSYPNLEHKGTPITIRDLVSFKSGFEKDLPDRREIMKNDTDSMPFNLKKMEESYDKEHFFNDLKTIQLDTLPGTVYKYSNASVQLAAHILENVYQKSYETLLKEKLFYPLNLKSTKLTINRNETIANGYNGNHVLMPNMPNSLWGAAGSLKSSMSDLAKLLQFELGKKNKLVLESQRNLNNSDGTWNGYFWDEISVDNYGLNCWKHGGAFGTQNMFVVCPELNLGISVIVNISDKGNTANTLRKSVYNLIENLTTENETKKKVYGYKITNKNVVFSYEHPKKLDINLIKSVSIAGTFNNWNTKDINYQMTLRENSTFEITVPKSQFEKGKKYLFKFIINKESWTTTPINALNCDDSDNRNLIFETN
jgi:CubicO group peptidase (beta-lactamase class C family)